MWCSSLFPPAPAPCLQTAGREETDSGQESQSATILLTDTDRKMKLGNEKYHTNVGLIKRMRIFQTRNVLLHALLAQSCSGGPRLANSLLSMNL